jgi:hypothetical protein
MQNSNGKKFWQSKTLYVNLLAIAGLVAQNYFNYEISANTQVAILAGINTGLRLITDEEINW